jgi:integrase
MQLDLFHSDSEVTRLRSERDKFTLSRFARATEIGYGYDWRMFLAWCAARGRQSLPASPETVSLYMTDLLAQGRKVTTVTRRGCAIAHHHRINQQPSPVSEDIRRLLDGAQRHRREQPRQMRPLTVDQLNEISVQLRLKNTVTAIRDRAILVLGFASALRRSNLVMLALSDVEFSDSGLTVSVRFEKQDQEGKGRQIGIPSGKRRDTCAARCLRAWLRVRGNHQGPLFHRLDPTHQGEPMDGECVIRVVKKCVLLIGLDPRLYGAHSLRAGFVTAGIESRVSEFLIAQQTGHRSLNSLRRYFRPRDLFRANACRHLGL